MNLFLASLISPTVAELSAEETHHCVRVLRKKIGDEIHAIDGKGLYMRGILTHLQKEKATLDIIEKIENWGEINTYIILAVSPLRQKDRWEWMVEKAVELGVTEIVPLVCHNTITANIKAERIEHILLSATKQCKRARIPHLHAPVAYKKWVENIETSPENWVLMAYCEAEKPFSATYSAIPKSKKMTICIGPEGDFTKEEIETAKVKNAEIISLGKARLRTETAAIFALSMVKGLGEA